MPSDWAVLAMLYWRHLPAASGQHGLQTDKLPEPKPCDPCRTLATLHSVPALRAENDKWNLARFYARRYISYARRYCAPRLGDKAKALLQGHYLELRKQATLVDGTPVTVRGGMLTRHSCEFMPRI